MSWMTCALVLALTGLGFAQQSPHLADTPPIAGQAAQSSEDLTTPEVQQLIRDGLSSESALAGASVSVKTDDRAIMLMGNVASEKQHEIALRIAQSFTGGRQIVDKIRVTKIASE
jgi:osmotically-inducible protein OsmY